MPRSRKGSHRTTTKVIPDGDDAKQFPTGLSSVILALQYYWDEITRDGEPGLTPEQFCTETNFAETYGRVQALYRKRTQVNHTNPASLGKVIHRLSNQSRNIDFVDMRAFAEFVGLPTGLFLLFSQCTSDERRCKGDNELARRKLLELMKAVRRVVDATENYVQTRPVNEPLFRKIYDSEGDEHLADVGVLKMWADAFNEST